LFQEQVPARSRRRTELFRSGAEDTDNVLATPLTPSLCTTLRRTDLHVKTQTKSRIKKSQLPQPAEEAIEQESDFLIDCNEMPEWSLKDPAIRTETRNKL
jgi:hypothetical protein